MAQSVKDVEAVTSYRLIISNVSRTARSPDYLKLKLL
jgi:hypothetical protein